MVFGDKRLSLGIMFARFTCVVAVSVPHSFLWLNNIPFFDKWINMPSFILYYEYFFFLFPQRFTNKCKEYCQIKNKSNRSFLRIFHQKNIAEMEKNNCTRNCMAACPVIAKMRNNLNVQK